MKKNINWPLILILLIAAILRFYHLMHDDPYFFNPDERNMASAVTRFSLPEKIISIPACLFSEFIIQKQADNDQRLTTDCSFNPHFFAYGQFPLYLAYASDNLIRRPLALLQGVPLTKLNTDFPSAVFWLRFWSAVFSIATVYAVYRLALLLSIPALPAALFTAFLPGLIQSAHFGTTESVLTFSFTASVYFSIKLFHQLSARIRSKKNIVFSFVSVAISTGLASGSKLTGLFFLFPPLFSLMLFVLWPLSKFKNNKLEKQLKNYLEKNLFPAIVIAGAIITLSGLFFILSSPYNLVRFEDFLSAVFGYERDVATGKYEAFYTRQFLGGKPIIFQMKNIFPFVLGWPVFILSTLGFLLILLLYLLNTLKFIQQRIMNFELRIKNKSPLFHNSFFLILTSSFLVYLLPNSFLFAKWSRFMTPVLPFLALYASFFLNRLKRLLPVLYLPILFMALIPGLAFMSVYLKKDTRVQASEWIYRYIPKKSYVLSETANVVDIPLGMPGIAPADYNTKVVSFDFYHLEERTELKTELVSHLARADYIFIPSRRIFKNFLTRPDKFPTAAKYYRSLFSGELGFTKVAEFSSYPQIGIEPLSIKFPDEDAEETYTVFDHPVIRIYRKTNKLTPNDYFRLLNN